MLIDWYVNIIANLIIEQYFTNTRCLIIISDEANHFEFTGNIPYIYINGKNITNDSENDIIFNYFGCQGIVIKTKTPLKSFTHFESIIRHNKERFNFRKYLFLPSNSNEESFDDFFQLNELTYVSDLLLIVLNNLTQFISLEKEIIPIKADKLIFNFLTHKYVGITNNTQKIVLDKWFAQNQSFLYNSNLYPNKLSNQYGRILKMACFSYEPYSVIGNNVENHYGSELILGVSFAKSHNMTPVIVTDEYEWGDINNWTGNGVLGNIAEDKADIGFSALYTWEYCYHYLDLSMPLIRTGITLLVPAPKLAASWLTPILTYSSRLWLAILFVIAFSSFGLYMVMSFYQNNEVMAQKFIKKNSIPTFVDRISLSLMYVGKLVLLQTLSKQESPTGTAGNHIIGCVTILSLLITCTYSGGLASIMTIPRYEATINTVDDFVKNNKIKWGATSDAWITSIQNAKSPNFQNVVSRFVIAPAEKLRELSLPIDFGLSLERLPYGSFAIGQYIRRDVIQKYHLMKEDLYWEQCVFMTRKNSILLPILNRFVLKVAEAGLASRWQTQTVYNHMDPVVQRAVKYYAHHTNQDRRVEELKFVHVEGAFAILFLGFILSAVCFIYEIIKFKRENKITNVNNNYVLFRI